jgi:hypothetical protein
MPSQKKKLVSKKHKLGYNKSMSKLIHRKRSDTKIGSIEKQHDVDFGVRSDKKLGQFLKEQGLPSLSKALEKVRGRR